MKREAKRIIIGVVVFLVAAGLWMYLSFVWAMHDVEHELMRLGYSQDDSDIMSMPRYWRLSLRHGFYWYCELTPTSGRTSPYTNAVWTVIPWRGVYFDR